MGDLQVDEKGGGLDPVVDLAPLGAPTNEAGVAQRGAAPSAACIPPGTAATVAQPRLQEQSEDVIEATRS